MMLAFGDALAVSLIDAKGFNKDQFGIFHPGGKIGTNFVQVRELMRKEKQIPLVEESAKMSQVLIEMTSKHLGCTGIINRKQQLIGVITDGDLRRNINEKFLSKQAKEVMTKNPITVLDSILVVEAVSIMNKKSITSFFVVDKNKKTVGILHLHDCLRSGIV
jgi:arabinose-5-phosphate isomerase